MRQLEQRATVNSREENEQIRHPRENNVFLHFVEKYALDGWYDFARITLAVSGCTIPIAYFVYGMVNLPVEVGLLPFGAGIFASILFAGYVARHYGSSLAADLRTEGRDRERLRRQLRDKVPVNFRVRMSIALVVVLAFVSYYLNVSSQTPVVGRGSTMIWSCLALIGGMVVLCFGQSLPAGARAICDFVHCRDRGAGGFESPSGNQSTRASLFVASLALLCFGFPGMAYFFPMGWGFGDEKVWLEFVPPPEDMPEAVAEALWSRAEGTGEQAANDRLEIIVGDAQQSPASSQVSEEYGWLDQPGFAYRPQEANENGLFIPEIKPLSYTFLNGPPEGIEESECLDIYGSLLFSEFEPHVTSPPKEPVSPKLEIPDDPWAKATEIEQLDNPYRRKTKDEQIEHDFYLYFYQHPDASLAPRSEALYASALSWFWLGTKVGDHESAWLVLCNMASSAVVSVCAPVCLFFFVVAFLIGGDMASLEAIAGKHGKWTGEITHRDWEELAKSMRESGAEEVEESLFLGVAVIDEEED